MDPKTQSMRITELMPGRQWVATDDEMVPVGHGVGSVVPCTQ
jgi:hypothetical protein